MKITIKAEEWNPHMDLSITRSVVLDLREIKTLGAELLMAQLELLVQEVEEEMKLKE